MKNKRKFIASVAVSALALSLVILSVIIFLNIFAKHNINYQGDELLFKQSQNWEPTVLYAVEKDGDNTIYKEYERLGSIKRNICVIDEVSGYLKNGFIAVEDQHFYKHSGVNFKRTAEAAINYILRGDKVFGASTITQQVVKNISGDNGKTVKRKLAEILRAIYLEQKYSKDEIFEVYLNIVPMGGQLYGVSTASSEYFGKTVSELTCAEAATLIGIANAPSVYNPYSNPQLCLEKRNKILSVMASSGVIDDSEYRRALSSPLSVLPESKAKSGINSWFTETAVKEICTDMQKKYKISESAAYMALSKGGYSIYTTVDLHIQVLLEDYFSNSNNFPEETKNGLEYSMVVTDSSGGKVLGIIGRAGRKSGNLLLNHATALHTPASALKPLSIYAPMIEKGMINWSTVIDDTPVFVGNGSRYPHNSPDVYDGLTTVKDALKLSKNTIAVKLCNSFGLDNAFLNLYENLGIKTLVRSKTTASGSIQTDIATSPLALGQLTDGMSLLDLTRAYSAFANDGVLSDTVTYTKVVDAEGNTVLEKNSAEKRLFKETTARIMNQLLRNVTDSGTASSITIKNKYEAAGKTGTSSQNREKIFVGYTPYITVGIWCGFDKTDRSVSNLSKSHLAIWDEITTKLHEECLPPQKEQKRFSTQGLLYLPYCMDSGEQYTENCMLDPRGQRMEYGYFTEDNAPKQSCHRHVFCEYDCISKGVADSTCPENNRVTVSLISIPERSFSHQIFIRDAEFAYRTVDQSVQRPEDTTVPYFQYEIPDGTYVGISGNKRQFNCAGKIYE